MYINAKGREVSVNMNKDMRGFKTATIEKYSLKGVDKISNSDPHIMNEQILTSRYQSLQSRIPFA